MIPLLISSKAFISLAMLCLLPVLTRFLEHKMGQSPLRVDLWVIRGSLVLVGVGYSVIGLSQYGTILIVGAYCNSVHPLLMHLVLMITYFVRYGNSLGW